ncbi:hypothetical protein F2P81_003402 [Scophthalmus maximus]|uniref:Uncharacterized protein n=1 Tax=Scophthalmus maximus TaxID=52904 RepID=A0A6A4TM06_SCOMX|nr:hypothetical protein F2P81_003402 [Scophthalmus maximus]
MWADERHVRELERESDRGRTTRRRRPNFHDKHEKVKRLFFKSSERSSRHIITASVRRPCWIWDDDDFRHDTSEKLIDIRELTEDSSRRNCIDEFKIRIRRS